MNFKLKRTLLALTVLSAPASLRAQIVENYSFTPNLSVQDGTGVLAFDAQSISSSISSISSVAVTLNIASEWNSDLVVYLRHGTSFSMLLNRVGIPETPLGYDDMGFDITLRDDAAHNVHSYRDF